MKQDLEKTSGVVVSGRRLRARLAGPRGSESEGPTPARRVPVTGSGSLPIDGGRLSTRRNGELRLHLDLSRHTPPGTYTGTVTAGGREVPVTLVVPERTRVRLSPDAVHLTGDPGSVHTVDVVVENRGNVPVVFPKKSAGFLAPKGRLCASFRQASRGSGKEDTAAGFLDRFARAVATSINQERAVMVGVGSGGEVVVAPGETAVVALSLTIPKRLLAGNYRARVPLGRTGIRVFVATAAKESKDEGGES